MDPSASQRSAAEGEAGGPARILVVDDAPPILHMVASILRGEGYEVETAESGAECLELLEEGAFDLIMLDYSMPGMNGFETCAALREMPNGRAVPVVFLTGMTDSDAVAEAFEVGGDDYLTKPFSRAGLLIRVRSLLRLGALRREQETSVVKIQEQREALDEADRLREELIEFLLHDLEFPLARVRVQLKRLGSELRRAADTRSALREISHATEQLDRMVANLLDVSRSPDGRPRLQTERVRVPRLLQAASAEAEARAAARGMGIEMRLAPDTEGVTLSVDRDKMSRVLASLLDNALRYGRAGGRVMLGAAMTDEGRLALLVSDDGEGPGVVSGWHAVARTDDFAVDGNPSRSTGLGLLFCRLVAEAHGGRLIVEPGALTGLTVCVELPVAGS